MPELNAVLHAIYEVEHRKNRFAAAMQGIDIEKEMSASNNSGATSFEDIKARVFSGGQAKDANDILALQGINAQQAGFGIGMGLDYVDAKLTDNPSW